MLKNLQHDTANDSFSEQALSVGKSRTEWLFASHLASEIGRSMRAPYSSVIFRGNSVRTSVADGRHTCFTSVADGKAFWTCYVGSIAPHCDHMPGLWGDCGGYQALETRILIFLEVFDPRISPLVVRVSGDMSSMYFLLIFSDLLYSVRE